MKCPFLLLDGHFIYSRGTALFIYDRCGTTSRICELRDRVDSWEDVLSCPKLQRLHRAFSNKEWSVIKYFWGKSRNKNGWELLVFCLTKKSWRIWRVKLGEYLVNECRKEKMCPFKAMLM